MVVACAFGFGLLLAAYGLLPVRWGFYLLAFPHGVVWSGLLTATMATLGQVLPPDRRAEGLSVYGLASPAGVVFGPLAGLAVFEHWGFATMTWILGAIFLVLGGLAFNLAPDAAPRARKAPLQLPGRAMLAPALVLLATALGYGALGSYTAQEGLALGFRPLLGRIPTASAFLTCMAVGMVLMRLFMIKVGFVGSPTRLLPGMLWTTAAALALLAFMTRWIVAPCGWPRCFTAAATAWCIRW